MSDLPSTLRSLAPTTFHRRPGLLPTFAADRTLRPSTSQMLAWPLSSCHKMSALPAPLKSAVSITLAEINIPDDGVEVAVAVETGEAGRAVEPQIDAVEWIGNARPLGEGRCNGRAGVQPGRLEPGVHRAERAILTPRTCVFRG